MFGGILEVTKESEELYVFHIPTSTWKMIDYFQGPLNLDQYFKESPNVKSRAVHSNKNIMQETAQQQASLGKLDNIPERNEHDILNKSVDLPAGAQSNNDLLGSARRKPAKRHAPSVQRMGGTSYSKRGLLADQSLKPKNTFGIIPTLTTEMKEQHRVDQMRKLKNLRNKEEESETFVNTKRITESPTSMKMKNTFLLQNSNPSFDNYAAQMKKRKMANTMPAGSSLKESPGLPNGEASQNTMKNKSAIPQARDGHVACNFEGKLVIFGGDRHHMPFNDLFMIDLDDYFGAK